MRISKNRLSFFFIMLVTLLTVFSNTLFAAAQMDVERNTSLTIRYNVDKNPVSGIEFKLYRVADISSTGRFTAVGDFAGYAVSFDGLTSEGWTDLARTLEGCVLRDKQNPVMRGKTDRNGIISFSDCEQGLYLLVGDKHTLGQYTYTPQSLLVSLPSVNKDGSWDYDVTSEPKFSSDTPNDTPGSDDPNRVGGDSNDVIDSGQTDIEKLPQTGMLKWPIPVMYILGTGIFFTGYCYRKKDTETGDENE